MKVAQLLGLQGPWGCQVHRDMDCLHHRIMALSESFFEPLVVGDQKASLDKSLVQREDSLDSLSP